MLHFTTRRLPRLTASVFLVGFGLTLGTACSEIPTRPEATSAAVGAPTPDRNLPTLASDPTAPGFGYTKENPIHVGGDDSRRGPRRERDYLDRLRGPQGQRVSYQRQGSCCGFSSPNGMLGIGLLDIYVVTYDGQPRPATLYLDMYDAGPEVAPAGFTLTSP